METHTVEGEKKKRDVITNGQINRTFGRPRPIDAAIIVLVIIFILIICSNLLVTMMYCLIGCLSSSCLFYSYVLCC